MTIDEIKQALREMKKICSNSVDCDDCPLAVLKGIETVCPTTDGEEGLIYPFEWPLDWPENEDDTKRSTHREE